MFFSRMFRWMTAERIKQASEIAATSIVGSFVVMTVVFDLLAGAKLFSEDLAISVAAGSSGALIVRGLVRRHRVAKQLREQECCHPSEHPLITAIVLSLKYRAAGLRFQALLVLILIVATLGAGIYVFATADRLSRTPVTRAVDQLEYTNSVLSAHADEMADLKRRGAPLSLQQGPMERVETALMDQQRALESVQEIVTARANDFTTSTTISVLSTRIGIVLMILFLVQILVTMYRYNSRLAAHLEGRAVALQLASLKQDQPWSIAELVNLFGGDSVDFGKLPPTAIQSFADVLKTAAVSVRKQPGN